MRSIFFLIVLLAFVSCNSGGGGSKESTSINTSLTFSNLIGYWSLIQNGAPCSSEDNLNLESYISFSVGEVRKVFMLANFIHTQSDCSDKPFLMHTIGYEPTLSSNIIDFDLLDEKYWIMDADFVDTANSNLLCGFSDWKLQEFKSIKGTVCSINPSQTFRWTNVIADKSTIVLTNPDNKQVTFYPAYLGKRLEEFKSNTRMNHTNDFIFDELELRDALKNHLSQGAFSI